MSSSSSSSSDSSSSSSSSSSPAVPPMPCHSCQHQLMAIDEIVVCLAQLTRSCAPSLPEARPELSHPSIAADKCLTYGIGMAGASHLMRKWAPGGVINTNSMHTVSANLGSLLTIAMLWHVVARQVDRGIAHNLKLRIPACQ